RPWRSSSRRPRARSNPSGTRAAAGRRYRFDPRGWVGAMDGSAPAPAPPRPALPNLLSLGVEVDDHVSDRHVEALSRPVDDAGLEPVRPALGMRRDDDLVGAEGATPVRERLERIRVPDLAARRDPRPR